MQDSQFDGQFTETFTRYRCGVCGALWEQQEDQGLRGYQCHWRLLEAP